MNEIEHEVSLQEEIPTPTDRVLSLVRAPSKSFVQLKESKVGSVILVSMLVSILLSVLTTLLFFTSPTLVENSRKNQIEELERVIDKPSTSPTVRKILKEQQREFKNTSKNEMMLTALPWSILSTPLIIVILSLLTFLVAKIIERGSETQVRYSHALAVTSLAGVIMVTGGLFLTILSLITRTNLMELNLGNALGSQSIILNTLAGLLNPVVIWTVWVASIGTATIASASRSKALLWISMVLVTAATILGLIINAIASLI